MKIFVHSGVLQSLMLFKNIKVTCLSLVLCLLNTPLLFAQSQTNYEQLKGMLDDGTECLMWVPKEWNGVVIRDLDFASFSAFNPEPYNLYLKNNYAVIGTSRHKMRTWQYDPVREIKNLDAVLDIFISRYNEPEKTIQYGCSGGGFVSLGVAEEFSDRIDGSVALAAHTAVWFQNTFLDGWTALRSLIGEYYTESGYGPLSDLQIINFSNDMERTTGGAEIAGPLVQAWRNAINAAYQSETGRARLVLAFAIGQWFPRLSNDNAIPDLSDPDAVIESIYNSALMMAGSPGGAARIMFENAAYGQQLSWNNDIDYRDLFENANPTLMRTIEKLYSDIDAELMDDISKINKTDRVEASDYALDFWSQPGRTVTGDLKIPTIRMHILGDHLVPVSLLKGYEKLVDDLGKNDLYRDMYIESTGHCDFIPEETLAAVQMLLERIDTGRWPDSRPRDLNEAVKAISPDAETGFMSPDTWEVKEYNRTWVPN